MSRIIRIAAKRKMIIVAGALALLPGGKADALTVKDLLPIPSNFKQRVNSNPKGSIKIVDYYSTALKQNKKASIHLPPGYSADKKYNVFYCLHGIDGNETQWHDWGDPDIIIENLYAAKKVEPMIIVYPNADQNNFEADLLTDLMPYIEKNYPTLNTAENRALAGYSWGGGQSLNTGLGKLGTFKWVGGFSSAPDTKAAAQLVPKPEETNGKIGLLFVSCGTTDNLLNISQNLITYFKANKVTYEEFIESNIGHDMAHWEKAFYLFTQLAFQKSPVAIGNPAVMSPSGRDGGAGMEGFDLNGKRIYTRKLFEKAANVDARFSRGVYFEKGSEKAAPDKTGSR